MACYIFTWSRTTKGVAVSRQELLDAFSDIEEIKYWRASTGAIFVVSDAPPAKLGEKIRQLFPELFFMFTEIRSETSDGWTDQGTWDFIQLHQPAFHA